ncbi:GumC family protein [Cognataquiflexum rubidum]|uniref:GumC family protein n=1 Tax=Cognataquiflexum rubidum TaxID=2922273 RepID=UPI001F146EFD|nr:polysaccharide biosynthesis tyrosine autokinase [Cognataquiflexum rubidum]MCH6234031.1 polysaccharide biosynthesis tyrosine autokinase [Cognataquiflexum rubidum]
MENLNQGLFQVNKRPLKGKDLKALLFRYLRYWYLFVIGVLICMVAAVVYIRYYTTLQYNINGTLLIKDENSSNILTGGISNWYDTGPNLANETIILKSKNLMERVFIELALNTSYFIEGRFRDMEVYRGDLPVSLVVDKVEIEGNGKTIQIRSKDNNNFELIEKNEEEEEIFSTHKFGQEIIKPYATFTVIKSSPDFESSKDIIVQFHDLKQFAENYRSKLTIKPENPDANVLLISLTDAVPKRGELILKKLIEVYNRETVEDQTQSDLTSLEFLDERITILSTQLSEVEKDVESFKIQNNLTDITSNAEMFSQSADTYNKEMVQNELQLDIIRSLEEYVSRQDLDLVPSSLNIQDPTLNGLIAKYNELQLERQRMLRSMQPSSSLIQNVDDQLKNLKINIQENLRNIRNGLVLSLNNMKSTTAQYQSKIRKVPSIERDLLEINRQQGVKQAIYLFLLQRREEVALTLASAVPNSRVIDIPEAEGYPFNNSKTTIYLAAFFFGLLVPFGFIYLKDLLNDKVLDRMDVERIPDIPILGDIYHSKSKEALQVVAGSQSVVAETFRLVRSNLGFANLGRENKVILITSSRSGEGKTFFSINLAASLALTGKRVVVLGFDLRKPKLMQDLGLTSTLGISNYLIDENLEVESLTIPVPGVEGLFAINSGALPPNPAELMMKARVSQLVTALREKFDYIIIDSAPVGQVADVYNLAPYIDSTIYLVRYNYTYKSQLTIIADIYLNKKLNRPMVVLNDAKKKNSHVNGYGYGYGYSGSNGQKLKKKVIASE